MTELPFLDLTSPSFSTRSTDVAEARTANCCARTPFGLAVLRHRDVGLLLRDRRLRQGSYAWPATIGLTGSFADFWTRSIISAEGDTHRVLRQLAVPALSPDFITSLKARFGALAMDLADRMRSRSTCEFMQDFSIPFAGQAVCVLLGIDPDEWQQISLDASDLGLAMGLEGKCHEARVNAAYDRLNSLAAELVARTRGGENRDSYIARLLVRFDAGSLNEQALLDLVVISIFGGVDTTRAQLGFTMALFAEHPAQWQILRERPDLIPNAIEESIRARPTITWATREALEFFEWEGVQIKAGVTLLMLVHASARDPEVCDDSAFDIAAERKMHFGFGGGAHHCLGHLVARTDMASALAALVATFARFDYASEPEWMPESGNTSPIRLPLRYELATEEK